MSFHLKHSNRLSHYSVFFSNVFIFFYNWVATWWNCILNISSFSISNYLSRFNWLWIEYWTMGGKMFKPKMRRSAYNWFSFKWILFLSLPCLANQERTLILLKPDWVQRRLIGKVIERFEGRGLNWLFQWFGKVWMPYKSAALCYSKWSKMSYCLEQFVVVVHGSNSPEAAIREINIWVQENELISRTWSGSVSNSGRTTTEFMDDSRDRKKKNFRNNLWLMCDY